MKKLIAILSIVALFAACTNNQEENKTETTEETVMVDSTVFGENITIEKVADARRLPSLMESTQQKDVKLIGEVVNVCQMSGCWLDIDIGNNQVVHVTFKDEAFVVPKDLAGRMVMIDGIASTEILSVDMQKKIAADEGKPQTEIDNIQNPVTEYYFEAKGLAIK